MDGKVTLNSRFLLDALNALDEDKLLLGISGTLQPILIKNFDNKDYIHIVMPLKG